MKAPLVRQFGALSVVRLGKTDWRICSSANPEELLGYIERQRGGLFEVMWMTDPIRWGYAPSFDEALLAFDDSIRFSGEILGERARVADSPRESVVHPARRSTWLKPNGRSSVA